MKKTAVYSCYLVLSSIGNILRGQCGCPAGIDGRCNHVAATTFALEEYCKEREKLVAESDESCTSKPCKWNVPRKRKGSVVPIAEMSFTKHDYAKRRSNPGLRHDVRSVTERKWPKEKTDNMLSLLKEYQQNSGKVVGWIHILPQEVNHTGKDNENFQVQNCSKVQPPQDAELISPVKEHPISLNELMNRCERV